MTRRHGFAILLALFAAAASRVGAGEEGWLSLFNGTDTKGWKLRQEKITVTNFFDAEGNTLTGAKYATVEQKMEVFDANGKLIPDAKIVAKGKKNVVVDAQNKIVEGAKIKFSGGRKTIVDSKGVEVKGAKGVAKETINPSGWVVEKGELICAKPHGGNDLLTEKKFTDFELHIEFQGTSNSGVYLQGRYEIQVDNSINVKPNKEGKLPLGMCGALYGQLAPSKNMAKPPMEWQTFDVTFRAPRGENGKVTEPARVTLIWNGEKVIDNFAIKGPTGGNLDGKVLEPGPLLLQGDHGRVAFRNIKIRPLTSK